MNLADLKKPFPARDIEYRIGPTTQNKSRGLAAPYLKIRAIQELLDNVCGAENWKNEFDRWGEKGAKCGISIRVGEEWITKFDGAGDSDIESVKGGFSNSMKRAAVQWGIGRYLYELPAKWVALADNGKRFADGVEQELDTWYMGLMRGESPKEERKQEPEKQPTPIRQTPPTVVETESSRPSEEPPEDWGGFDSEAHSQAVSAAAAAVTETGEIASQAQVRAIYAICKNEKGWTDKKTEEESTLRYFRDPGHLTKRQAHEFIDWLKGKAPAGARNN